MSKPGLYGKYIITKADGSPVAPEADYFVLRLDTDKCARHALRIYANNIEGANPELAADLRRRLDEHAMRLAEERLAVCAPPASGEVKP